MNTTLLQDLIGLAELGVEHRECAELDCTSDRHTIATARKFMATAPSRVNFEITAETVHRVRLLTPDTETEVAVFDSSNGAFHHRQKWLDRGYAARTARKVCGGVAVLVRNS